MALRIWQAAGIAVVLAVVAGCAKLPTVSPVLTPCTFLASEPDLASCMNDFYGLPVGGEYPHKITAYVSQPSAMTISYMGSASRFILSTDPPGFLMGPGVYPFTLKDLNGTVGLCGAMTVSGLDETVTLATFGKNEQTCLFSPGLIQEAQNGTLACNVITFDNKPIIRYWLGNRTVADDPAEPTAQLDFSKIPNLLTVRVNGKKANGMVAVAARLLPAEAAPQAPEVMPSSFRNTSSGGKMAAGATSSPSPSAGAALAASRSPVHKVEIELTDGRKYKGFIRNIADNAFTTFCKVPCTIPPELFTAADGGTVARFTVVSATKDAAPVAEITFGPSSGR